MSVKTKPEGTPRSDNADDAMDCAYVNALCSVMVILATAWAIAILYDAMR